MKNKEFQKTAPLFPCLNLRIHESVLGSASSSAVAEGPPWFGNHHPNCFGTPLARWWHSQCHVNTNTCTYMHMLHVKLKQRGGSSAQDWVGKRKKEKGSKSKSEWTSSCGRSWRDTRGGGDGKAPRKLGMRGGCLQCLVWRLPGTGPKIRMPQGVRLSSSQMAAVE